MQKSMPTPARACRLDVLAGLRLPSAGGRLLGAFGAAVAGGKRRIAKAVPLGAIGLGRSVRGHAAKLDARLLADGATLAAPASRGSLPWASSARSSKPAGARPPGFCFFQFPIQQLQGFINVSRPFAAIGQTRP